MAYLADRSALPETPAQVLIAIAIIVAVMGVGAYVRRRRRKP